MRRLIPTRFARKLGSKRGPRAGGAERELVAGITGRALAIVDPAARTAFVEKEIRRVFGFARVELLVRPQGAERFSPESTRIRDLLTRLAGILEGTRREFLDAGSAASLGVGAILGVARASHLFRVARGEKTLGVLLVDAAPGVRLHPERESLLVELCTQLVTILESSNLLRAKDALERELGQQAHMAQLGAMTARIAHEVKNPLSAIKTIIQVMQEDPLAGVRFRRDLELIVGEIDRLEASVVQLLGFARPVAPAGPVDLRAAAESTVRFLERDIQAAGAGLSILIPAGLPAVAAGAAGVREIFLNLLLNALQSGGEGLEVRIDAREERIDEERFVVLTVEDTGPGIPRELQAKVFAPFFTTRQRGTGLGLAIVKRNVEHAGGRIEVESPAAAGRGTRMVLYLPAAAPESTRATQDPAGR